MGELIKMFFDLFFAWYCFELQINEASGEGTPPPGPQPFGIWNMEEEEKVINKVKLSDEKKKKFSIWTWSPGSSDVFSKKKMRPNMKQVIVLTLLIAVRSATRFFDRCVWLFGSLFCFGLPCFLRVPLSCGMITDGAQVVSAHMQISTSAAPFSATATTQVGIRAPNNAGNTLRCGVSGGLMATASTTRLSVTQSTSIGGNLFVVAAHVNAAPMYSPTANITFSYMTGASPDFSSGAIALTAWPTLNASTHACHLNGVICAFLQ
jgi:hypothetical protein